jgi:hypothetical protein
MSTDIFSEGAMTAWILFFAVHRNRKTQQHHHHHLDDVSIYTVYKHANQHT